jgi:hypothetical protein
VDDVLQETAVAALRQQVDFATPDELLAWSTTVARRLAVAEYRRERRSARAPERTEAFEHVEDEALARLTLARVLLAAEELAPADRAAFAEVAPTGDRRADVRAHVRRHRARRKLLALAGGLHGVLVLVLRRLRALLPSSPSAAALGTVALVGLVLLPHASVPGRGSDRDDAPPRTATGDTAPAMAPTPDLVDATESATAPSQITDAAPGRHPADAPTGAPADRPGLTVLVDGPAGADAARAGTRPKEAEEPVACVRLLAESPTCVAVPFPSTPLDESTFVPGG